ncbi:MAG: hypothetical protein HY299_02910 [Verrucomicrobia bacterium]|nr:hypothetical protein [Verrucomicrobiota bacterium]
MKLYLFGFLLLASTGSFIHAAPLGTAFTFQGRLADNGVYPTGHYELRVSLWDDAAAGSRVGNTNAFSSVDVTNGLFTVSLDFGSGAFNGAARWLQLGVRSNGVVTAPVPLSPRMPVSPAPHSLFAANAASAATAATATTATSANAVAPNAVGNAGLGANAVTAAKIASGEVVKSVNNLHDNVSLAAGANITITANGNTLTLAGSADWKLDGNAGTTAGSFLGTIDNMPVRVKVNGDTGLRVEPSGGTPNIVGGFQGNRVSGEGGAVAGGGNSPYTNRVTDSYGFVGGGLGNLAGSGAVVAGGSENQAPYPGTAVLGGAQNQSIANYSAVGGGLRNTNLSLGGVIGGGYSNLTQITFSTVGGGLNNAATNGASTVGGGQKNIAGARHSTVAGGGWNTAGGVSSFVGGGGGDTFGGPWPNTASGNWSSIVGGWNNTASGYSSVVGGGGVNTAAGTYGVVPGGSLNEASGSLSFAAGYHAKANHSGSFVWSDQSGGDYASTTANQFSVRAAGGVRFDASLAAFSADLSYQGALNKLDVADNFTATIRAADLTFGYSGRRGSPGRVLVDLMPELWINFGPDWITTVLGSNTRVQGDWLMVEGSGHEQAYLGGDGFGGDVQLGSQNPSVGAVTLWNTANANLMSLGTKDVAVSGELRAPGLGVNTGTFAFLAKKTNAISGFDHVLLIDHPMINDNPNALLFAQHNYNGDFRLENKTVGVYLYTIPGGARRWGIYHEDLSPMPAGAAFNVMIVKP